MGFFADLFEGKQAKVRKSHFRNLCTVALADGVLTNGERDFLMLLAVRCGVTPDEAKRVITNPRSIEFVPPDNDSDRVDQLIELVHMMMIDGDIDERELTFCMTMAVKMGFRAEAVGAIVKRTIEAVTAERSLDQARGIVFSLLR